MISKAEMKDIKQIMPIISGIIKEMQEIQNYQWDETYPTKDKFVNDIENGNLYVYKDNSDKIMGFVCIDSLQPDEYSSLDWKYQGDALVIHRMAVAVNSRGMGIGKALMKFTEDLAEQINIKIIRSDTYSTNKAMNFVFEKSGYRFVGNINLMEKPLLFNCYEKFLG